MTPNMEKVYAVRAQFPTWCTTSQKSVFSCQSENMAGKNYKTQESKSILQAVGLYILYQVLEQPVSSKNTMEFKKQKNVS